MAQETLNYETEKNNEDSSASTPQMSKRRIMKNLIALSVGFLFLFCGSLGLQSLQTTMYEDKKLGIISQSVGYAAMIISALFLPKLIIRKFGCKVTLVICTLLAIPWLAANYRPSLALFVPFTLLSGLGSAPLWAAQCTYVNEISVMYSSDNSESTEVVTSRFFGIFLMIYQSSQIFGNLVTYLVLKPSDTDWLANRTTHHVGCSGNGTWCPEEKVVCGAGFCQGKNENLLPPSDEKRYVLMAVFLGLVVLSAAVFGFFLDQLNYKKEDDDEGVFSRLAAVLKQLKNPDQLLLVPMSMFVGIQMAFILADFSEAYVACAWGVYHIGLVSICMGVVDAAMSIFAGHLVKYVSRMLLMYTAAALNLAVFVVLYLWEPNSDQFVIFFLLAGVLGVQDAIFNTQVNAFFGLLFRADEEAAFSNNVMWQSIGATIAFSYTKFLCVVPKLSIIVAFTLLGMLGYTIVEIRNSKKIAKTNETTEH